MRRLRVTGLVGLAVLSVSACAENVKTKEELSKLGVADYAVSFCKAFVDGNIGQLQQMYDEKVFARVEKKITPDQKWYVKRQEKLGECVATHSKTYNKLDGRPQKYSVEFGEAKVLIRQEDNDVFYVENLKK